jgi:hypothetical protein
MENLPGRERRGGTDRIINPDLLEEVSSSDVYMWHIHLFDRTAQNAELFQARRMNALHPHSR